MNNFANPLNKYANNHHLSIHSSWPLTNYLDNKNNVINHSLAIAQQNKLCLYWIKYYFCNDKYFCITKLKHYI